LMQNFKICYPLGKDTYIAPILLPTEEPLYTWDETDHLTLRYEYEFMPKGIVTRFIVEMHAKIECAPDNSQLVWKNGVILTNGSARVEVIEDFEKKHIRLRAIGFGKKSFLAIVRHEFQKIHNSYERLEYKELIPCNCSQCTKALDLEPHRYALKDLESRLEKGKLTIECYLSFADVKIRELIDETIEPIQPPVPPPPRVSMNLRQLVEKALTDDELLNLCYDFKIDVTQGQTKDQRIRALVEYIERQGKQSELLNRIEQLNSNIYKEYLTGNPAARRSPEPPIPGSSVYHTTINNIQKVESMSGNTINLNSHGSGDNIAGDKVMGDKINTQINNSQNLTEAAKEIQALLDTLSETYNPTTPAGQEKIGKEAIESIEQNPTLKGRITKAMSEGGYAALEAAIDRPIVKVCMAAFKGFTEGK
jgi:C-terminal of Roc, COR, domain/Effector-associated domain 7